LIFTLRDVCNLNALVRLLDRNGGVVGGKGLATIDSNLAQFLALSTDVSAGHDKDGENNGAAGDDCNDYENSVIIIIVDCGGEGLGFFLFVGVSGDFVGVRISNVFRVIFLILNLSFGVCVALNTALAPEDEAELSDDLVGLAAPVADHFLVLGELKGL